MPAAKKPSTKAKTAVEIALEKANETPPVDETATTEEQMSWPLPVFPLTAKFDIQVVELEGDQKAIVLAIYTGAGSAFALISHENATMLGQRLKKAGNTMTPGPVR
jgi:hypothetical protein